jgi:hypothetical protein
MEPASTIALSLALGASATAGHEVVSDLIKDAYAAPKSLIKDKYPNVPVEQLEQAPESKARRAVVEEVLTLSGAEQDASLLAAAHKLTELIQQQAPGVAVAHGVDLKAVEAVGSTRRAGMQRFWNWVMVVLRRRAPPEDAIRRAPPEDAMLNYFLTQIEVRLRWLAQRVAGDEFKKGILDLVSKDLTEFSGHLRSEGPVKPDEAWNQAYRLERLLALAEPEDTLYIETQRRLEEAAEESVPSAARLRTAFTAATPHLIDTARSPPAVKPGGETPLRAMLLDILEETHWELQRKFHGHPIEKSATRRLVTMGLLACFLFVLPYIWLLSSKESPLPLGRWAWLPLWTAVTAGLFGAMFSRLLYLQTNRNLLSLSAIKDARDVTGILLRGAVGITGAVIVYFFLQSGVIGGSLFPKFHEIGITQLSFMESSPNVVPTPNVVPLRLILPNTQLALLVVWSFLAGFSERLVSSILQSTETSLREGTAGRQ